MDLDGPNRAWVVVIMVGASVVKLGLMLYCRTFTNEIVRAYALDHVFDVVTNVIGLVAAILASMFSWWIDPVGAIVVNLFRSLPTHPKTPFLLKFERNTRRKGDYYKV